MAMSKQMVATIVLILIFLVIDGIVIAFWITESNKLKTCKVTQSLFCPTIACNANPVGGGGPTSTETGANCFPYAYRKDENGQYVCNWPNTRGNTPGVPPSSS